LQPVSAAQDFFIFPYNIDAYTKAQWEKYAQISILYRSEQVLICLNNLVYCKGHKKQRAIVLAKL